MSGDAEIFTDINLSGTCPDFEERAWYSEFDFHAAAWLRELIARGLIPAGTVDDRDMREVVPSDVEGVVQAHWFAGIGGWPHALRLASWPEDRPVWTASLPCQPFSGLGKTEGKEDERHLWPDFRRLVAVCLPATLLGEQVAAIAGREWFADVRFDLEHIAYWRALEAVISDVREADSSDSVAELLASVFGVVESIASESPADLLSAVDLMESEKQKMSCSTADWAPTSTSAWREKQAAAAVAGHEQALWQQRNSPAGWDGSIFWDGLGGGEPGGAGVMEDCRLLFGAEQLAGEREFSEAVRNLIAGSRRRLSVAGISDGMEALGYEVAAADLPACSVGAPHKRNRLYWVAHADSLRRRENTRTASGDEKTDGRRAEDDHELERAGAGGRRNRGDGFRRRTGRTRPGSAFRSRPTSAGTTISGAASGMADADGEHETADGEHEKGQRDVGGGGAGGMADADGEHRRAGTGRGNWQETGHGGGEGDDGRRNPSGRAPASAGEGGDYWASAEFFLWADGKARRTVHRLRRVDDGVSPVMASGGSDGGEDESGNAEEAEIAGIVGCLSADLAQPTWAADLEEQGVIGHLLGSFDEAGIMPEDSSLIPMAWQSAGPETREAVGRCCYERGVRLQWLSPLAAGEQNREPLIKGYGNAIVPQVGALFAAAVMETVG